MTQNFRQISHPGAFGRVAVLFGGNSAEREISLLTGKAVLDALLDRGVDAHPIDARDELVRRLLDGKFDRVWIALHGRGGEDGTVQGLLDMLGLPYTGSGVLGSALGMDKLRTKQLLTGIAIPTPAWRQIDTEAECAQVAAEIGCPLIVKPALEGSSLGMSKVERAADLPAAWRKAMEYGSAVFAESWINGPEYTAAILHDTVLPLIRIAAAGTFYDYEAKYFSDETRYICPCGLPAAQEQSMAALAMRTFRATGASGWGRVDFMVDDRSGQPFVLEVNTVPGMTSHSLVPMAAKQAGIDFGGLVWRILETSFAERSKTVPAKSVAMETQ